MRRRAYKKLLKGVGALAVIALIVSSALALIGYLAMVEHDRRVEVLASGHVTTATVTESARLIRSACKFRYQFSFDGTVYSGGEGGCPLVDRYPVGSRLQIRSEPTDPENSMAEGAALWPGWAVVPLLLLIPLLFLGGIVLLAIIQAAFHKPKRRRNPKADVA